MTLFEFCIKRPVFAIVLNLIIVLIGLITLNRLPIREYPNMDMPVVSVETTLPGASPELIESQITTPLEESLAGIEGINYILSHSRPEYSEITLRFLLNRDLNVAISDVRDKIGRVRDLLPKEVREPVVSKMESNAEPIIWLAFSSDRHSPLEVSEIIHRLIKDRIQTIPGVANVTLFGERRYSMRIWLNPARMGAYQLTALDIEQALRAQNLQVPSGRITNDSQEFNVLTESDLSTPAEFENIVLKNRNGYLVRLKDVATVTIAPKEDRQEARFNGEETVALGVVKQSTANPLEISKQLKARLPSLQKLLPADVKMEVAYDSAIYIDKSIHAVGMSIVEAVILVIGVIFIFLHSFRATLIPLVTIPISLLGACAFMYFFHFSINTLTLLAMVLAIGLVVDDAIVVLENCHRYIEQGKDRLTAALLGIREIGFAIIAMTLTLAFVFVPIVFATGQTGKLFVEFALSLAAAVLVSGFTALTLSPMMCGKLLTVEKQNNAFSSQVDTILMKLKEQYQTYLRYALQKTKVVLLIAFAAFLISIMLFLNLKSELAPIEDKGNFIALSIAPEGSNLKYTAEYSTRLESFLDQIPEVENHFSAIGFPMVSRAIAFISLKPWEKRSRSQQEIVESLTPNLLNNLPGVLAFPLNPMALSESDVSQPIEIVLQSTASYDELKQVIDKVVTQLKAENVLENIDTDLQLNTPQLKVEINRNKIASVGTSVEEVSRTIESLISGRQVTRYKQGSQQYDVIIQVPEHERITPDKLYSIYVRGKNSDMIPLINLVQISETRSASELNHFNKMRSATLRASLGKNISLDQGLQYVEKVIRSHLPEHFQMEYAGTTREFKESKETLFFTFILALCFIYLVLAAQFESFKDPFIILISVPLALMGALLALTLSGGSLNIYSQIGLITLIGLISKHGILIVEFSNQLCKKGIPLLEAIEQAAIQRFRPILMTTAAMVLGALPLAFASGAGKEARHDMGWVIVGGLLIGTLFTLFVVPVIYYCCQTFTLKNIFKNGFFANKLQKFIKSL